MRQNMLILAAFVLLVGGWATTGGAGEPVDTAALGHVLDQWAVAWSSGDVNQLLPLFTDDVLYEDVTFGAVNKGKEALRTFATAGFEAFPGSSFALTSRLVASDGKWGALEWVWRGKQTKDLPSLPATSRPFEVRGASIVEFREDKISRCSDYWDLAQFIALCSASTLAEKLTIFSPYQSPSPAKTRTSSRPAHAHNPHLRLSTNC